MPIPAFGGMKAPAGLDGVTQLAVENAGAAQTMKSAMTVSLTATMMLLKRDEARMPTTSSVVMMTMIAIAGRFKIAPVDDQAGCSGSYASGADAYCVGMTRPRSLAKLTT